MAYQVQSLFKLQSNAADDLKPYNFAMTFAQPQLYLLALCASYMSAQRNNSMYDDELLIIIMYPLLRVQLDVPILYPYAKELIARIVEKQNLVDCDLSKIYASVDTHVDTE